MLIVAGVFDDLKAVEDGNHAAQFIHKFNRRFELGTTWSGAGKMKFFANSPEEAKDFTIRSNDDDKLRSIYEYAFSLEWVKQR